MAVAACCLSEVGSRFNDRRRAMPSMLDCLRRARATMPAHHERCKRIAGIDERNSGTWGYIGCIGLWHVRAIHDVSIFYSQPFGTALTAYMFF
jgi:hypothetical protein